MDNIRPLRLALGDVDRESATLPIQSSYRLDGSEEAVQETVPVRCLDTVSGEQDLTRLDLVKIDVDGVEGRVFAGAKQSLERFRPAIFFELGPAGMRERGDDPEDILSWLLASGYRLHTDAGRSLGSARALLDWIGRRDAANVLALPDDRSIRDRTA